MKWRCKVLGHKLTGKGERVPGKCQIIRHCQRCNTPVVREAHHTATAVSKNPCIVTTQCTQCGAILGTTEQHDWSYWEQTDPAKKVYTRYCHNPQCTTAEETKHEHQWEITSEAVGYDYDNDLETSYGVTVQERRCKTCQATETIDA